MIWVGECGMQDVGAGKLSPNAYSRKLGAYHIYRICLRSYIIMVLFSTLEEYVIEACLNVTLILVILCREGDSR